MYATESNRLEIGEFSKVNREAKILLKVMKRSGMLVLAYTDSFLFLLERLMTPVIIREAASTSALSTLRVKTGATASPPLYCGSPSWKFWRSRTIHFWRSRSVISSSPVKPSTGGDKAAEAFLAISKEMVINGTVNEIARKPLGIIYIC